MGKLPKKMEEEKEPESSVKTGKMQKTEETEKRFVHSAKVPQLYKNASKILEAYDKKQGSLKSLLYGNKICKKIQGRDRLFSLLSKIINNRTVLMEAIKSSNILAEQPRFNPYMAQVLTGELFHKEEINGQCVPILVFREYQAKIRQNLSKDPMKAVQETRPRYVRVNTLNREKFSVISDLKDMGFVYCDFESYCSSYDDFLNFAKNLGERNYIEDYHIPDLLLFAPGTGFFDTPLYNDHAIILQDKASCLPVFVSNIYEGCNVIDACAAPGNKTSHMAAKMKNKGKIFAFDRAENRFQTLRKRLEAYSATCAEPTLMNFFKAKPEDYPEVEYIFIDPSCSASGTNHHSDRVEEGRLKELSRFQANLLSHGLSFPGVKEVIYSTCSVFSKENEEVVDRVLSEFEENFELADLSKQVQGWKHFGLDGFNCSSKCLRTNLEDACSGFFVAKFVRRAEGDKVLPKKDPKKKGHIQTHKKEVNSNKRKQNMEDDASKSIEANVTKPAKKKKLIHAGEGAEGEIEPSGAVDVIAKKIKKKKKVNSQEEQNLQAPKADGKMTEKKTKKKKKDKSQDGTKKKKKVNSQEG